MNIVRIIATGILATGIVIAGFSAAAFAAPGDHGEGKGGCVDNLHGNATNERPSGNGTLPSQSPGPFVNTGVNEPPRNDRQMGLTVGDVQQLGHEAGLTGGETIDVICLFP